MKHKDDFLKKVIITLGIFLLLFTISVLVAFFITGNEPSTLIASVFAACLGEGSICGFLKKIKMTNKENDIVEEDEEGE